MSGLLTDGQRRMLGAPDLAAFLTAQGRPARVLDDRPSDLGFRDAHVLRVSGSPIDRISLRLEGVVGPRQLLGGGSFLAMVGPVPLASRGGLPVQARLLLDGAPDPGPARLVWQTEGLLRKTRIGASWRGGAVDAGAARCARDGGGPRAGLGGQLKAPVHVGR